MKPLKIKYTPKYHGPSPDEEKDRSVNVDMNPMVDLAFLLLTFFMLATTFNLPQAMELVLPVEPKEDAPQQEQAVKESKALTFLLAESDALYWYEGITDPELHKIQYDRAGLRTIIQEKQAAVPDLIILIKPAKKSSFKNLVDILDEMNINEVKRYAIVDFEGTDEALIKAFLDS